MEYLNLSNNQINDIHSIANKPTLTELHIANNHIKSISSLKNLKKLTILDISNNTLIPTAEKNVLRKQNPLLKIIDK